MKNLKVLDFDYYLPEELIAQHPISIRDHSKLLVYHRRDKRIEHRVFYNIKEYLKPGDCLVINDTRVIPARLYGVREDTGGKVELLLLENKGLNRWETMVRPGRRVRTGSNLVFGDGLLKARVVDVLGDGTRIVEFRANGIFEEILDEIGLMPLPPYIHEKLDERERYQTVYNRYTGSSAAPTAGLHFTEGLIRGISDMGIKIARITLHVGLGTFRPVKENNIEEHRMHFETYKIPYESADTINQCRNNGGRIFAVGTTSTRTLEATVDGRGLIHPGEGKTDIFIYPGYNFKAIDGLITNFHLPKSTLIMLVSALIGREETLRVYEEAVSERYRFFSFGDAMLIL